MPNVINDDLAALLLQSPNGGMWRLPLRELSREDRSALQYEAERLWWALGHAGWQVLDRVPPELHSDFLYPGKPSDLDLSFVGFCSPPDGWCF